MVNEISKDEDKQQPIPVEWRQKLREIVEAIQEDNFQLRGILDVEQLSIEDAAGIAKNISRYGARLTNLPEESWNTSVCQWMRGYWDALIDLYTVEEGASDLALSVQVFESPGGYTFRVQSIHVP